MYAAGIVAISDDGKSVRNAELLRKASEYVKFFGIPVISHCEDEDLSKGFVHEGAMSLLSGLDAVPSIAEEIIVMRDMAIARYTGATCTSPISRLREAWTQSPNQKAIRQDHVRHLPPLLFPYRRGDPFL